MTGAGTAAVERSPDYLASDDAGDQTGDRSVAGRIADALARRIISGALPPGAAVRQDHVAHEFGASHVPVREAFRKLEAQGLLVSLPRRGVRVAPLDPADVREVTAMRAALEGLALRQAMPALTAAALAEAKAAIVEGEASDRIDVWEAANRRFHRALSLPAAMPRLLAAVDDLQRVAARYLHAAWQDLGWQPRSQAEHRAILAAVEAGDGDRAVSLLDAHIRAAGETLARALERRG